MRDVSFSFVCNCYYTLSPATKFENLAECSQLGHPRKGNGKPNPHKMAISQLRKSVYHLRALRLTSPSNSLTLGQQAYLPPLLSNSVIHLLQKKQEVHHSIMPKLYLLTSWSANKSWLKTWNQKTNNVRKKTLSWHKNPLQTQQRL